MQRINDGQERIVCPYNAAHYILKERFAKHLAQCQKNFPCNVFKECPFDKTHRVPGPEYDYHVENCPQNNQLHREFVVVGPKVKPIDDLIVKELDGAASVEWPSDDEDTSYLAKRDQVIETKPIFRLGETNQGKAARKNFRQSERARLQHLTSPEKLD